jgi:arylsulfatase A
MDVNEVTVAKVLSEQGNYATGLIGKWHLGHRIDIGCLPGEGRRGFDYFYGLPYSHEEGYPGPFPEV